MSITLMTERPPYIKFEMRAIEDRNASLEHGRYMTRDVDYVIIMAAGAKDSVEHEAKPWLDEVSRKARQGQYNKQHADYFAEAYTTWKQTQDTPLSGSPIKEWTVLTPSERENLLTANMRTVEDLAVAPEDALMKIGMGARSLKVKAIAWLESASGSGKIAQESASIKIRVEALEVMNKQLIEQNKELLDELHREKPRRGRPPMNRDDDINIKVA